MASRSTQKHVFRTIGNGMGIFKNLNRSSASGEGNAGALLLGNLALAGAYFLTGKAGLTLASLHPSATAVWPPTGIALAAYLLFGYRVWPGVFAGAFLVNLTTLGTPLTSAGIAMGNSLEGLLGAYLVNRLANGRYAFERSRDVFRFVGLAGLLSTAVSATVGVTTLALAGYASWSGFGAIWLTWWLGDVTGALIVTPLLVLLGSGRLAASWRPHRLLEAGTLLAILVLMGEAVFGGWHWLPTGNYPIEFLSVPVLIWVAFRFGPRAAAAAIVLLSGVAIMNTVQGFGSFGERSQNASLLLLQAFLGTTAVTIMALAAAVSERRTAADEAARSTAQALAAEERVRREIAEMLHGRVQSRLLAAWSRLGACEQLWHQAPAQALALLGQVRREIDEIREQEVRQASHLLHPAFLREGLTATVDALVEQCEGHLAVTLDVDPALIALDAPVRNGLPEDLRLAAYRIIEEALNNIMRHAHATSVSIELGLDRAHRLTVLVRDDGRGFEVDRMQAGLGLGSIDGRVRQAGGRWRLISHPGAGTTLFAQLPLGEQHQASETSPAERDRAPLSAPAPQVWPGPLEARVSDLPQPLVDYGSPSETGASPARED